MSATACGFALSRKRNCRDVGKSCQGSPLGDNFPCRLIEPNIQNSREVPIQAGAAVETVGHSVVLNRAAIQQVAPIEAAAGSEMRDAGGVIYIRSAPLSAHGGQAAGIVV